MVKRRVNDADRYAGWSMVQPNCAIVARDVDESSIPNAAALGIEGIAVEYMFGVQRLLQSAGGLSTHARKSR